MEYSSDVVEKYISVNSQQRIPFMVTKSKSTWIVGIPYRLSLCIEQKHSHAKLIWLQELISQRQAR